MLTVGDRLPEFALEAVLRLEGGEPFGQIRQDTYPGKWLVLFSWPMDFTFVCPTEIAEFGRRHEAFEQRAAQVLGFSTDTEFVHLAWRRDHPELRDLPFPMLADTRRQLSDTLGILHPEKGVPLRATFLVDPEGVIRWSCVQDLPTGRNVDEVLRVLDALQTGELTPCNWQRGDDVLQPAL